MTEPKAIGLRVLLFENFRNNVIDIYAAVLESRGHETAIVYTTPDALTAARSKPTHCALLIVNNIHDADPFETAREIRKMHPQCAIVFATGHDAPGYRRRSRELGNSFVVHELPLDPEALVETVEYEAKRARLV